MCIIFLKIGVASESLQILGLTSELKMSLKIKNRGKARRTAHFL